MHAEEGGALYHPDLPIGVPYEIKVPLGRLRGDSHPQESGNSSVWGGGALFWNWGAGVSRSVEDGEGLLKGSWRSQEHIFQPVSECAPASSIPKEKD